MQELGKLFGSEDRVKIIRFFLANTNNFFQLEEISKKTKVKLENLKKELLVLEKATLLLKSKERFATASEISSKTKTIKMKEFVCYKLDKNFRFLKNFQAFMFDFENANRDVLKDRFNTIGRTKLFMLSGVFVGDTKSRCDILYVGEAVKKNIADKVVADLEAEIGKKLEIMVLDLEEFDYRYKMFDRYVRDALKDKKEILINKLSLGL